MNEPLNMRRELGRGEARSMRPIELLLDSCEDVLPLLADPELARRWSEPSVLTEWSNQGLAGHLARSAFNLERAIDQSHSSSGNSVTDATQYYTVSQPDPPDSAIGRRIRELGDHEASLGPSELVDRFTATTADLRRRLPDISPAVHVDLFGSSLLVDDCATACLLELVVHADDLAVSLGLATPSFATEALDLVVRTLARISETRHGSLAVIRTFARSERAPTGRISAFEAPATPS